MPPIPAPTGSTLLLLAVRPDDLAGTAADVIAAAARRGRPPLVVCAGDGVPPGDTAALAARAARAAEDLRGAMEAVGVPRHRVLVLGLPEVPGPQGRLRAPLVAALVFLAWSRDCGAILCAGQGEEAARLVACAADAAAELGLDPPAHVAVVRSPAASISSFASKAVVA